jgi:hypothetical protein
MNDVQQFFEAYREAWRENSAQRIESFWATDEPAPFYKAEEIDEVFTDWSQLRAYWAHNQGFNDAIELSFDQIRAQSAGPGRQLVAIRMRWDIRFSPDARNMDGSPFSWAGKSMGGSNHVIAMLADTANGPRLAAWIEAPNAPITYMAELYMQNVRPGFSDQS